MFAATHPRPTAVLAVFALLLVACGGGPEATDTTSTTVAASPSTESTAERTTTSAAIAETTTTAPSPPFEDHLADGLLSLDDLPDGYVAKFENGMLVGDDNIIGDYALRPCGIDVPEPSAIDARQSSFTFDTAVKGFPPEGVLEEVIVAVRSLNSDATPGIVELHRKAANCAGQEVNLEPDSVLVSPPLEVTDVEGVNGTGVQWIFTTGPLVGRSILIYVFEVDDLDGYLFLSGAAPDLTALPTLAAPIVEAFQQRLAACSSDREGCSFAV